MSGEKTGEKCGFNGRPAGATDAGKALTNVVGVKNPCFVDKISRWLMTGRKACVAKGQLVKLAYGGAGERHHF
jgi:hypothetical protein